MDRTISQGAQMRWDLTLLAWLAMLPVLSLAPEGSAVESATVLVLIVLSFVLVVQFVQRRFRPAAVTVPDDAALLDLYQQGKLRATNVAAHDVGDSQARRAFLIAWIAAVSLRMLLAAVTAEPHSWAVWLVLSAATTAVWVVTISWMAFLARSAWRSWRSSA